MRPAAIASHAAEAKLGLIVEKKSNRLRKRQRRRVVGKREHASLVAIRSNGSPSLRRRGRKGGDLSFPPFFPRNLVELLSAQAVSKLFRSRRILVGGESRIVPAEIVEPSKSGISRNNRDARRVRGGEKESTLRGIFICQSQIFTHIRRIPATFAPVSSPRAVLPYPLSLSSPLLLLFHSIRGNTTLRNVLPVKSCQIMDTLHSPFSSDFLFVSRVRSMRHRFRR